MTDIKNLSQGNEILSRFQFDYSAVNQQIKKTETLGGYPSRAVKRAISNYSYDDSGRLTTVTDPAESFTYDAVGNRDFGAGTSHNAFNQIVTAGSKYSFTYDLLGNMTSKTDLATGEVTIYEWNSESQLLNVQHLAAGGSVVRNKMSFKYDGLGRRISLDFVNNENPSMSYNRRFFYDGAHVIEEQDANGNVVASHFYGPGVDNPIYSQNGNDRYVYTKDHLGSIRDIVKLDGTLVQRNRYSAYGITTQELAEVRPDAKLVANRFGFTGRELDAETGLYYYRARYYDPTMGRFITKDPLQPVEGGSINPYTYANNNPVNYVDPDGESPVLIGMAIGAFIGTMLTPTPTDTHITTAGEAGRIAVGATIGAGLGAAAVIAPAVIAAPNANPYIRIGEGKFPEPYSQRISIGNTPGKKAEIGMSESGRIDIKLGNWRTTVRPGTKNTCGGD